jgi:lysophospholipase L1-like esterase
VPLPEKPPRWKRFLQNLALSSAVFLLCVAVFEGILRLAGYGKLEIYQPDPALYWKLKPSQDCYTKIGHKPVHINSRSTRGKEFQIQKQPGTLRILCLGDSRTFGWGLSEAETYSGVLETLFHAEHKAVEVINAGVNAWSFPQMLVYFRETAAQYEPDFVILGEANPWTQFSEKNSPQFVKKFMTRVRLKNFLRRFAIYHFVVEVKLKDFYEKHRTRFIPVDPSNDNLFKEQQQADPAALFQAAIEGLCQLSQSRGIKPILLYLPSLDEAKATEMPVVLKAKQAVSQKLNVPLIDLTPEVRTNANTLYLEADPVHFNESGNRIIARRLFEVLNPLPAALTNNSR